MTLTAPADGAAVNQAQPTFSGLAGTETGDSTLVLVELWAGTGTSGTPLQTYNTSRSGGSWTLTAGTLLADGAYTARARQADAAGNVGYSSANTFTLDTSAPTTTINTRPSDPTNQTSASFGFSADQPGSSFQCRVDAAAFAACTSPQSYNSLADGPHSFQVKATDPAGNTGNTATFNWTIVTVGPDTTISTKPANPTNSTAASFTFASPDGGATFECRLDGAAFSACTSPKNYSGLAQGSHTFDVRARDAAGNTDPSPATHTWTIDTTPPTATITAKPADPTNTTTASFSFTSDEPGSSFECRLDGTPYAACTSPRSYTAVPQGAHTFDARATDAAGNTGAVASAAWTVDTTPPGLSLTSPPTGTSTTNTRPTFSGAAGTATGDESAVLVKLYAGATVAGTPIQSLVTTRQPGGLYSVTASTALGGGTYTAQAEQADAAGNTGVSPATTFIVEVGYRTAVLRDSPGGYWRLGEASGTTAADETGTSNGTYQNGVALGQAGAVTGNTAASFDGTDDLISVPNAAGLNATSGVTVEAWVKRTKTGAWQNILAKPGNGANAAQNYALWLNTTNQVVFVVGNGSTSVGAYAPAIDTNWHFVAATYDNATAKVYVDGVLKVSASSTVRLTANSQPLLIGRTTDNVRIFGGTIDEPAVYTTALSASQIQSHYSAATATDTAAPTVTLTTPASGATLDNRRPTFSGAAGTAAGDSATVTLKIYAGDSVSGALRQTLTTTQAGGTWSVTPTTDLADGTYTVQAEQSDDSGNLGTSNATTFSITSADLTPPAVAVVSPATGSATSDTTPTISGAAGVASGDLPSVTVKIWRGLSPSGAPLQTLTATASGGSWATDATVLTQSVYTVRAEQSDTSSNIGFSDPQTFTVGTSYPQEVLSDGPSGYWRLGEASGTTAADAGGANAGSYQNGVLLAQPGRISDPDTAAQFDGVDDLVSVPHSASLNASTGVTVEAWVKRTTTGVWQNILGKPGNGANAAQNYALWLNTTNQVVFIFGNGSASGSVYGPSIDTNWHHVTATYDNTTARIYIDGVQQASSSSSVRLTTNTLPLLIGRSTDNVRIFGGVLDEVVVYTKALAAARIQAHYSAGNTFDTDPPVVTLTTPDNGSSTLNTSPHFAGQASTTATDSTAVTVRIYSGSSATGQPVQTVSATWLPNGAWSVDAAQALAIGTYTAQAEQLDAAGNVGRSPTSTFAIIGSSSTPDPVIAGAGDIADCTGTGVRATANLILGLPTSTTVMTLGDNAYPSGAASDFSGCYDPWWGQFKSRTRPAIGDHEYETPNASGYFNYFAQQLAPFGASATDPNRAYYSYDLGTWHVVVLNGACAYAPACSAATQAAWLDADLTTNANQCTMAILSSPRWSSGSVHGSNATMAQYFKVLYDNGVELVLSGDDHLYERFAPTDPQGFYDPTRGVRQLIVGTGGGSLYSFGAIQANSEVRKSGSYGIVTLALHAGSYQWQFVPTSGTFSDSGSSTCH